MTDLERLNEIERKFNLSTEDVAWLLSLTRKWIDARSSATAALTAARAWRDTHQADRVKELEEALREARDALNGAPNTVGLHAHIDTALGGRS